MVIDSRPTATETFLQPPAGLLKVLKDPRTGESTYAFPLQTEAWIKMQDVVRIALSFPLSKPTFKSQYGDFSNEGVVETALMILGMLQTTASQYGDPETLISQIPDFQKAN